MKFFGTLITLAVVCGLGACTTMAVAPMAAHQILRDDAFNAVPETSVETRQAVFALDESLVATLKTSIGPAMTTERKLNGLLTHLYTGSGIRLAYTSGHTTPANQTWLNKQGDCLSLTILAYAAAKALGIPAVMQDVRVPPVVDRRGEMDFVNGHVNVYVPTHAVLTIDGRTFEPGGLVIDFQPHGALRSLGTPLQENEILARFYNNRASEFMLSKRDDLAYAYFKAALSVDPAYAPTYGNLASLYHRKGLVDSAETLLRHAVALNSLTDVPLRGLHQLLVAQGRNAEAQQVLAQLARWQSQNPYYWLGLGIDDLQQGRVDKAVSALERAQELSIGFQEVHYHLALAYLRSGQRERARDQVAVLGNLGRTEPAVALLSKKLN